MSLQSPERRHVGFSITRLTLSPCSQPSALCLSNPRAQPKSATKPKNDGKDKKKAGKTGKPTEKKARSARPKPKTAEELDTEMNDYWNAGSNNATAPTTEGAAASGAAPADAMEEISVSS